MTEQQLRQHIQSGSFLPVYLLYGEETYLSAHYARQIGDRVCTDESLAGFNRITLDGQACGVDEIASAAEAMPVMAERKGVVVRDFDIAQSGAGYERMIRLVNDPPADTVLVFWMDTATPDRKSAKWKAFLAGVDKNGGCVELPLRTPAQAAALLTAGAAKRGVRLSPENADRIVQQNGCGLALLLNELDKLSAAAPEGEITRGLIEALGTPRLEVSVFELSKALLKGRADDALRIVGRLMAQREDPVAVLAVLSNAYADLYRVKMARAAGRPAEEVARFFGYKGREFRLRNASRDGAGYSLAAVRAGVDCLARADTLLKSSRMDKRIVLEQTVVELAALARTR